MLAEGEKPWLHEAGFDETYAWSLMGIMSDVYKGTKSVAQFDSVLNHNIKAYPKNAYRMYFTSNHDENSWNGTEFEKYGDAYKTFAVFTQTMFQSVPLIYSGQEIPNKKRLKFFVKDPIEWNGFAMAPFYKTLLSLRKTSPALAADASYRRLATSNDESVFSYVREKNGRKVIVILNLSGKEQKFTIADKSISGMPYNVFLAQKEKLDTKHRFSIEPWGYVLYDFR
jgi:glycosidase